MSNLLASCKKVSSRILEDWGMMLVDEKSGSKDLFDQNGIFYCATTNFRSKANIIGSYSIVCQENFLNLLANNLITTEETPSFDVKMDALRELSNLLAGNLTTTFYGTDTTFDLSPPNSFEMPVELSLIVLDNPNTVVISVESIPVAISFSTTENSKN